MRCSMISALARRGRLWFTERWGIAGGRLLWSPRKQGVCRQAPLKPAWIKGWRAGHPEMPCL